MPTPKVTMSRMDEEACAWASRLDAGLEAGELAALRVWLARDPAHAWRLAHFRQFYAQLHGTVPRLLAEGRLAAPAVRSPRRRAARWTAGLAAAAAVLVAGWWHGWRDQSFTTHKAECRTVALADGSVAELNARTQLRVNLHGKERHVQMPQGEAFFAVAKDPAHPFFVETPAGTVRVTGTRFNVRTDSVGALEVTVLEGSVAVAAGTEPEWHLRPQEQITVAGGLVTMQQLTATATENVVAWREGKVVFDETPLADALAHFAAYHGRVLTAAPEVAGLPLGGRYTLADLDEFIRSVEKMLPVRTLRGEHGAVRFVPVETGGVGP